MLTPKVLRGRPVEDMRVEPFGDLWSSIDRVKPFTLVTTDALTDLGRQVGAALTFGLEGAFVECGVWRGGAAFLMADLLRRSGTEDRKVWLFDSFEGMPAPSDLDGVKAAPWSEGEKSPFSNCFAPLEEVMRTAEDLGLTAYTEFVKGWFDESLPAARERVGPIALLRIDSDWYWSVRRCLEELYDQVVDGGFVVLDDYYDWDGCAIATHEFLGARRLVNRIESVGPKAENVAVFRKGGETWAQLQERQAWPIRTRLAENEIAGVVSSDSSFVLVDDAQLAFGPALTRRPIPFLEQDGEYMGSPPDDLTAIQELERLRRSGAEFLVIAWPAFWWLDYYWEFHRYLRTSFECVLENDRLTIFDMRGTGRV